MNKIVLSPREERVVKYLKNKTPFIHAQYLMTKYGTKKGITVKECIDVLGTTELRKIVSNIREKGVVVTDRWEVGENVFGEETRYKRYFITGMKRKEH